MGFVDYIKTGNYIHNYFDETRETGWRFWKFAVDQHTHMEFSFPFDNVHRILEGLDRKNVPHFLGFSYSHICHFFKFVCIFGSRPIFYRSPYCIPCVMGCLRVCVPSQLALAILVRQYEKTNWGGLSAPPDPPGFSWGGCRLPHPLPICRPPASGVFGSLMVWRSRKFYGRPH